MSNELDVVYDRLVKAKCPEEIFGKLDAKTGAEKENALKSQYHYLLKAVHADHVSDPKQKHMADEATRVLIEQYKLAKDSLAAGTYGSAAKSPGKSATKSKVESTFEIDGKEYRLFSDCIDGDFCRIQFGERQFGKDLENIVLKVPHDIDSNELMRTEAEILKKISHKSMPVLLDSLELGDGKVANAIRLIENGYDLYSVREHFPSGLPQEHAAWVLQRLLSVLGYLHINKTLHGSIEPGNIIIMPDNHNGILIDYLLGIPNANEDGAKYSGVNNYSAPEIEKGAKPHPSSDMYSLGKSMIYLMGGNETELPAGIDSRFERFIGDCVKKNPRTRKSDAWNAWHELKELRNDVFGAPHQFLELKLGGE
jgi:serine/threonine protein kinase